MNKKKWVRTRNRDELEQSLTRQIGHLRRSIVAYDSGIVEEAERLASSAYILLHDGSGRSKSLLGQLGRLDKMKFVNSMRTDSPEQYLPLAQRKKLRLRSSVTAGLPLCGMKIHNGAIEFVPLLHNGVRTSTGFNEWWGQQNIYETSRGLPLTRKKLVFALRCKDGGAHVDGEIDDQAYDWLRAKGDDAVFVKDGKISFTIDSSDLDNLTMSAPPSGTPPVKNAHWASMRQIAWELDEALKDIGL